MERKVDELAIDDDGGDAPREYKEGRCQQCCLRCLGASCWVFFGLCVVAWVAGGWRVEGSSSLAGAPSFARSLLWRSLAHHTGAWDRWEGSISPPPPVFRTL